MASPSTASVIHQEHEYGAHNYHPLPVVFSRAQGIWVWDPEGRKYMDFLSAYSAVNQGHCHPKIVKTLQEQAGKLHLSSRAFYNDQFGPYAQFITQYFGYDMVLPMNTGAEAVETAMKLARKWGYMKKGIPPNQAIIIACSQNFHGRTLAVVSMSSDPDCRKDFGPFIPNIGCVCPKTGKEVRYNEIEDLRQALEVHGKHVAAFLVEPIQGEAGIYVPDESYLKQCYDLCVKHNVLFMADEIQTGLARTGKMLCIEHAGVRPHVVILGKALSGGLYPVSAVLADKEVMLCIKPGEHGSTYGGNPLGCAVAMTALQVLKEENMVENSRRLGERLRAGLSAIKSPFIKLVRGKGLLNAVVIDESVSDKTAWHICLLLKKNGLLAKPTHKNIIRLAPPLCITEIEIDQAIKIFETSLNEALTVKVTDIPDHDK